MENRAPFRFFLDANMIGLAKAMDIVRKDVLYPGHPELPEIQQQTPDTEWLPIVSQRDLVIITRDKRIRHRASELRAFKENNSRAFVLTGNSNLSNWEMLARLARHWDKIEELVNEDAEGPWIYSVASQRVNRLELRDPCEP